MGWYDSEETSRAVEAYRRRGDRLGLALSQPGRAESNFDGSAGVVTLANSAGVLARYRVSSWNGGTRLRRLKVSKLVEA